MIQFSPNSTIIRGYLLKQVFLNIVLISLVTGLVLAGFYLRSLFGLGIEKQVPARLLLITFFCTQIAQFAFTLTVALMPGLVLALGSRHYHNEILALRGAGVSQLQIMRMFAGTAVRLLLFGLFLHQIATPWARGKFRELRAFIESHAPLDIAADGNNSFSVASRRGTLRHVRFSHKTFDFTRMTDLFHAVSIIETQINPPRILQLVEAERAYGVSMRDSEGKDWRYLRLENGYMLDFVSSRAHDSRLVSFRQSAMDILIAAPQPTPLAEERAKDSLYPLELWRKRAYLLMSSDQALRAEAADFDHEFHQRIALPFALPLILVAGLVLSFATGAQWRWPAAAASLLIAGGYYALFLICKMIAVKSGAIPGWFAAWAPNLLLFFCTLPSLVRVLRR